MKKFEATVLRFRPFREWIRVVVEAETERDAKLVLESEGYRQQFGMDVTSIREIPPVKGRVLSVM